MVREGETRVSWITIGYSCDRLPEAARITDASTARLFAAIAHAVGDRHGGKDVDLRDARKGVVTPI